MTKKFTKETWRRVLRTFLQVAGAYVLTNLATLPFAGDKDVLTSALLGLAISAVASGLAAVMNLEETVVTSFDEVPKTALVELSDNKGVDE